MYTPSPSLSASHIVSAPFNDNIVFRWWRAGALAPRFRFPHDLDTAAAPSPRARRVRFSRLLGNATRYLSRSLAKWRTASKISTLVIATLVLVAVTDSNQGSGRDVDTLIDPDGLLCEDSGQGDAGIALQGGCPTAAAAQT